MGESLDFTGLDLLMAFGGYLGLFIGASILSLYDIFINFFMKMVTKFKSRLDSKIKIEEPRAEIAECIGDQRKMILNDKSFESTKEVFTRSQIDSQVEIKLENSPIMIKMQENLVKQAKTIEKLEKLLAKQADLEKKKDLWK